MKALLLIENGNLQLTEVEKPILANDEVLVKVKAAGICGSDISRIMKNGAYHYPLIPGHEISGQIDAVGKKVDKNLMHRRVAVFPLLPCNSCEFCVTGDFNLCERYDYYGSRRDGGFAEYLAVKVWNLVFMPEALPFDIAALCEPLSVAIHAIRVGGTVFGKTVGIAGAGPIGLMLAHVAQISGALDVVLWDIDEKKVSFARTQGFRHVININEKNLSEYLQRMKYANGLDVVVEGTGSQQGFLTCLGVAKKHGTVVTMGNPASDFVITKDDYWQILRKELTIGGTWNSIHGSHSQNDWKVAIELLNCGKSRFQPLITHTFPLTSGLEPIRMMMAREEFYNKVMYYDAT